ncbi:hypothetical protein Pelo_6805 [Pelomyxa schiedti]|nr:hypothetical protein Pelo_6805 [Pelomyxa schiedti]
MVTAVMRVRIQAAKLFSKKFHIKLHDCIEQVMDFSNRPYKKKANGGEVLMEAFKNCQDKETLEWILEASQPHRNKGLILYSLAGASEAGSLKTVEWMARKFSLRMEDVLDLFNLVFNRACSSGQLSVAKWIASYFHYGRDQVQYFRNEPFRSACRNGHLEVAKWLADSFSVWETSSDLLSAVCSTGNRDLIFWFASKPFEDSVTCHSTALESLGKVGDRELISWFSNKISLELHPCRHYHCAIIRGAISGGHLNLAKEALSLALQQSPELSQSSFVRQWFGLACTQHNPDMMTLFDSYAPGYFIIGSGVINAALHGFTHAVQWYLANYMKDPNREEVFPAMLWAACAGGHLEAVKLIVLQRRCTKSDVISRPGLRSAIANGQLPVVKWLVVNLGITKGDIPNLTHIVQKLVTNTHISTAGWLNTYFELGIDPLWSSP